MKDTNKTFPGDKDEKYRLDSLSTIKNYYTWILQEFEPFLGRRILEIGAGIGTFSDTILSLEKVEKLFLLEPTKELMNALEKTFSGNPKIVFIPSSVEDICPEHIRDMALDAVVFVNVLEHIGDDVNILKKFSKGMNPGSRILTFSPAFQLLYGHIDATAGHYRRYTKKSIKQKFEDAGLKVVCLRYFNLLGFFSWLLFVKVLGADDFNRGKLKLYNSIIPFLQKMEKMISPPIGQSVIAVGEIR